MSLSVTVSRNHAFWPIIVIIPLNSRKVESTLEIDSGWPNYQITRHHERRAELTTLPELRPHPHRRQADGTKLLDLHTHLRRCRYRRQIDREYQAADQSAKEEEHD